MILLLILLLLCISSAASAAPRDYALDPVHSRVVFSVDHAGFSQAMATLSAPQGTLRFDPDDWSTARAEIVLDLRRLDFGDPEWNARMAKRDFFDVDDHPLATFRSTRVEPQPDGTLRIAGLLELRGTSSEVVLDARLNKLARHPLTLRRTAGFTATATLKRSAFGMRAWKTMIGDDVAVRIQIEARRTRTTKDDGNDVEK